MFQASNGKTPSLCSKKGHITMPRKKGPISSGGKVKIVMLTDIQFDDSYQRGLKNAHKKYVKDFDEAENSGSQPCRSRGWIVGSVWWWRAVVLVTKPCSSRKSTRIEWA